MMLDLMIDLETLDTSPTAAIVGIGAVFFDAATQQIGDPWYRAVNLATSVRAGGTIDPGTVMWWMGQSQEARDALRFSAQDLAYTLREFQVWVDAHGVSRKELRPWGNSASFDVTILEGAFRRLGMREPWMFWNQRCFRTVKNMFPAIEMDERDGTYHKADDDAVHQAKHVLKIARTVHVYRQKEVDA